MTMETMSSKPTHSVPAKPVEFEPEFIALVKDLFEQEIVFNRVLGLKVLDVTPERVTARIDMKPDLIGHFQHNRVHGGAVSAALDAMGGLVCVAAIGSRHMNEEPQQRLHRFAKLGTIDLRVDYLRPCVGEHFHLTAEVLRLGSRVANTRMEFKGQDGRLLCTGAGAYIVS